MTGSISEEADLVIKIVEVVIVGLGTWSARRCRLGQLLGELVEQSICSQGSFVHLRVVAVTTAAVLVALSLGHGKLGRRWLHGVLESQVEAIVGMSCVAPS